MDGAGILVEGKKMKKKHYATIGCYNSLPNLGEVENIAYIR